MADVPPGFLNYPSRQDCSILERHLRLGDQGRNDFSDNIRRENLAQNVCKLLFRVCFPFSPIQNTIDIDWKGRDKRIIDPYYTHAVLLQCRCDNVQGRYKTLGISRFIVTTYFAY